MNNKDENDLLTLLKLHCPEGVEIALPQTYKELLKKTMPSLGLLNLQASEPCEPRCEPCESFMRVFFFSSTGLGGRQLFAKKHRSPTRLSLNYCYKPLARHLESGDDPGDEYKRYNLAPRVISAFKMAGERFIAIV